MIAVCFGKKEKKKKTFSNVLRKRSFKYWSLLWYSLPPPIAITFVSFSRVSDCGTNFKPKEGCLSGTFSLSCPLSEVKIQTRELDLMTVAQTQNTMGKMAGGRTYKMSDIMCPFVYTLFHLPWEIWILISHPPNLEHLITFLIELVQHLCSNWPPRKERSFRNLLCSWSQLSPFVVPTC